MAVTDHGTTPQAILGQFETLKRTLTEAGIAALREEDFEAGQALTDVARAVKSLQERVDRLLGSECKDGPQSDMPKPARGIGEDTASYPRFFRRGEFLVKQALRRDGKNLYEQKLPRGNYRRILAALRALVAGNKTFHAQEVIDAAGCPAYHVYLLLLLLQEQGYLGMPERGLYLFLHAHESPWAEGVWDAVPAEELTAVR